MIGIVLFIVSVIITVGICRMIFANTIGTVKAYVVYGFFIWMVVMGILAVCAQKMGLF